METCEQKILSNDSEKEKLQLVSQETQNTDLENENNSNSNAVVSSRDSNCISSSMNLNNETIANTLHDAAKNGVHSSINDEVMYIAECDNTISNNDSDSVQKVGEGTKPEEMCMLKSTDVSGDVEQSVKVIKETTYRCEESWSEDEDSSSSDSDTSSDSDFFQMIVESSVPKKLPAVKTKGELGLDDLPPIEDLFITVPEEEMQKIGIIHAVVDKLVVIHALKDVEPLDLDSVLFLSHDKPLGRVFDVFGPVVQPFYSIRFNSDEHIKEKGVEIGHDVLFAPSKNDVTTFVFVQELQKQKGSDASWKYNNEPPEECLDFSDDEKEKAAKRQRMNKNRNRRFTNQPDVAAKRRSTQGDGVSNYRPSNSSLPENDIEVLSTSFATRNPFAAPLPPLSPTPSLCSVVSIPIRVRNSYRSSTPNQPKLPYSSPSRHFTQNILQRPAPPVLVAPYQQPHVFGQVTLLSPIPPMQPPPILRPPSIPTFLPPPASPNNYFIQRFSSPPPNMQNIASIPPQNFLRGSPSYPSPQAQIIPGGSPAYPNPQVQILPGVQPPYPNHQPHILPGALPAYPSPQASPNPWLPNEPPNTARVPPNHPLTVQIPNASSPPISANPFQYGGNQVQQFPNNMNLYNRQFRFN